MDGPLAYSIKQTCALLSIGRTALYEAIGRGELRAIKRGRRTLILPQDLRDWLAALPELPKHASSANTRMR